MLILDPFKGIHKVQAKGTDFAARRAACSYKVSVFWPVVGGHGRPDM